MESSLLIHFKIFLFYIFTIGHFGEIYISSNADTALSQYYYLIRAMSSYWHDGG
jgi:hypothetical protein